MLKILEASEDSDDCEHENSPKKSDQETEDDSQKAYERHKQT